ncbi:MAG TPA: hypothetical protein VFD70_18405 [Anaerolineae bacterium]|nr:hypothetical protein [Anaerolineae bacterium]
MARVEQVATNCVARNMSYFRELTPYSSSQVSFLQMMHTFALEWNRATLGAACNLPNASAVRE